MSKLLLAILISLSTLSFSCSDEGSSNGGAGGAEGAGDVVDSEPNSASEDLDAQAEETRQELDAQAEEIQTDADDRLADPDPVEETPTPTIEEESDFLEDDDTLDDDTESQL